MLLQQKRVRRFDVIVCRRDDCDPVAAGTGEEGHHFGDDGWSAEPFKRDSGGESPDGLVVFSLKEHVGGCRSRSYGVL